MYKAILFIVIITSTAFGQLYQGPAAGLVTNGVVVSTDNFINYSKGNEIPPSLRKPVRNKIGFQLYPDNPNVTRPSGPEGSNYIDDPSFNSDLLYADPVIFKSFQGSLDPGGFIPPDFYIAAGPTHIITVDNGRFKIWTKDGILVKSIDADIWFSTTLSGVGAFDPKVSYDHFSKRWIMVWLDQNDNPQRGYLLVSISDDSIPTGTWYNWALPSNVNGTTNSNSWGDYQGVGFDNQALYITTNQFVFGGGFQGTKIRIIPKTDLYSNSPGVVTWKDIWDIREPSQNSKTFGARPSIYFSSSSDYCLLAPSSFSTGTFFTLYKISNPLTTPVMTAVNVPVTQFTSAPNASQLGGSTILLEAGGSGLRNEPVYRDGFLWTVHSVKNTLYTSYSSVRYLKINTVSNTADEDIAMGANGFWHFYPALMVDKDKNIALTYTRSGTNEYAGAFYTTKLNSEPQGLSGSRVIQPGKANYVKDFSSGRNRWGDYNGIWLDPADQNNFWILSEYAETPNNTWAGWVAGLRLIPFSGAKIYSNKDSLDFGVKEVGLLSDTLTVSITSQGQDTLLISNLFNGNNQFRLTSQISYPIKLGYNQTKELKFVFQPAVHGVIKDTLKIFSNDASISVRKVILKGKGFIISPSLAGNIYGITGTQSNGALININKNLGTGSLVGFSGYMDITGISVRPDNYQIYAIIPASPKSVLLRINALYGDAYNAISIPIASVRSIAFDLNGEMYCAIQDGRLFKYNLGNNDTTYLGNTGISNLYSIAINPLNGQLWGSSLNNKVFKINKTNAVSIQAGTPGFSTIPSIAFNNSGKLYGTTGIGIQTGILISIDTATGVGTQIGSTGYTALYSIALSPQTVGITPISSEIPQFNYLNQNYPNPFNPLTNIEFAVKENSNVTLKIYDINGKEIAVLVNDRMNPGFYNFKFNASALSSGIYFYNLRIDNSSISTKKLLLMK